MDPSSLTARTPRELAQQVIEAIVAVQPELEPLHPIYDGATALPLGPWAIMDPQRRSVFCALVPTSATRAFLGDDYRIYQDAEAELGNCFLEAAHGQTRIVLRVGYLPPGAPTPPPYEGVEWQRSNFAGQEVFTYANPGSLTAMATRNGFALELAALDIDLRHSDREGLLAAMAAEIVVTLDPTATDAEIERFRELWDAQS